MTARYFDSVQDAVTSSDLDESVLDKSVREAVMIHDAFHLLSALSDGVHCGEAYKYVESLSHEQLVDRETFRKHAEHVAILLHLNDVFTSGLHEPVMHEVRVQQQRLKQRLHVDMNTHELLAPCPFVQGIFHKAVLYGIAHIVEKHKNHGFLPDGKRVGQGNKRRRKRK